MYKKHNIINIDPVKLEDITGRFIAFLHLVNLIYKLKLAACKCCYTNDPEGDVLPALCFCFFWLNFTTEAL